MKNSHLVHWLKAAFGLSLFILLLSQFEFGTLLSRISDIHVICLLLAFVLANGVIVSMAFRQIWVSKDCPLSIWLSIQLHYVATFAGNFLPSGIGSDAYKVYYFNKGNTSLIKASQWVLLDRLSGMLTVTSVGLIALFYEPEVLSQWLHWSVDTIRFAVAGGVLAGLTVIVFLTFSVNRRSVLLKDIRLHRLLIINLSVYGCQILKFSMLCQMIGVDISLLNLAQLLLVHQFVALIPLTIGGLGIVEGSIVVLLLVFGVSASDAAIIALFNRFIVMHVSLVGLVLWTSAKKHMLSNRN